MNRLLYQIKEARIVSEYLPKNYMNLGLQIIYENKTDTCWIFQFLSWKVIQFKQQVTISVNAISSSIKFILMHMNQNEGIQIIATCKLQLQNISLYKEREKRFVLKTPNELVFGELFIQFYQLSTDFHGFEKYHIFINDIDVFLFERLQKMYSLEILIDNKKSKFTQGFKVVNRKGKLKFGGCWHIRDIKLSSSITLAIKQKSNKLLSGQVQILVDDIERGKLSQITVNLLNNKGAKIGHLQIGYRMNNLIMENDQHVRRMISQIERKDIAECIECQQKIENQRSAFESFRTSQNETRKQTQNFQQKLVIEKFGSSKSSISEIIQIQNQSKYSIFDVSLCKMHQELKKMQISAHISQISIQQKITRKNCEKQKTSSDKSGKQKQRKEVKRLKNMIFTRT